MILCSVLSFYFFCLLNSNLWTRLNAEGIPSHESITLPDYNIPLEENTFDEYLKLTAPNIPVEEKIFDETTSSENKFFEEKFTSERKLPSSDNNIPKQETTSEEFETLAKIVNSEAEFITVIPLQVNESGNELKIPRKKEQPNDDDVLSLTASEVPGQTDQKPVLRSNNEGFDDTPTNQDTIFKMPDVLLDSNSEKTLEANKEECLSPVIVKMIMIRILKRAKTHPEVLDQIINQIHTGVIEESEPSKAHDDQVNIQRSFLQSYSNFDGFEFEQIKNEYVCPRTLTKLFKQSPKLVSEIRNHPSCLKLVLGCEEENYAESTPSDLCLTLDYFMKGYKLEKPLPKLQKFVNNVPEYNLYENLSSSKNLVEITKPIIVQNPNIFKLNITKQVPLSEYLIPPKKTNQESNPSLLEQLELILASQEHKPDYVTPDTNILDLLDIESKPITVLEYVEKPDAYINKKPGSIYIQNYGEEITPAYVDNSQFEYNKTDPYPFETIYINEPVQNINTKKPKHIYGQPPDSIYAEELKPSIIQELKPIYIEEPEYIYINKSKPINTEEPLAIYIGRPELPKKKEAEPTYTEEPLLINIKETKPIYINEPQSLNIEQSKFIFSGEPEAIISNEEPELIKKPVIQTVYIEEPKSESLYVEKPKLFNIEGNKLVYVKKPQLTQINGSNLLQIKELEEPQLTYIDKPKPAYVDESEPIYVEGLEQIISTEKPQPILVNIPDIFYIDENKPDYNKKLQGEKLKPIYTQESIFVEEPEPIYVKKPEPSYNIKPRPNTNLKPKPNSGIKQKPIFIETDSTYMNPSGTVYSQEPNLWFTDMFNPYSVHEPKSSYATDSDYVYINKLEPIDEEEESIFVENPAHTPGHIYIEKHIPESIVTPQPIYVGEVNPISDKKPDSAYVVDFGPNYIKEKSKPIIAEVPKLNYEYVHDPESPNTKGPEQVYIEESKPIYIPEPENINIENLNPNNIIQKPISLNGPNSMYIEQHPEKPLPEIMVQAIPTNVEKVIIKLINSNPRNQIANIVKILKQNQQLIKPKLYEILFSLLKALNEGDVDSQTFSEIVNYLVQPQKYNQFNTKKKQFLYYLLLPDKNGSTKIANLDVIQGLIQQPDQDSNSIETLNLILPLLKQIKNKDGDSRVNDIIVAVLNRKNNSTLSNQHVEDLLTFMKPNKKDQIPENYVDIASKLVHFDEIPYLSSKALNNIFAIMKPNSNGKVDDRVIKIINEILLPKIMKYTTKTDIENVLSILRNQSDNNMSSRRLNIILFILKNIEQAPRLIKLLINLLKDYDVEGSKYFDIILYLQKRKLLSYELLKALVSLLSQETTGNIDENTVNNLLLLLEPYKTTHPSVVVNIQKLLQPESLPTKSINMNRIPENLKVLLYYLINSGANQINNNDHLPQIEPLHHYDSQGHNGQDDEGRLKINLLSKIVQMLQAQQNRESSPDLLADNYDYIELTYVLKDQKPFLYHPVHYVKYKIPLINFLTTVETLLATNPQLTRDPAKLLQQVILEGTLSEVSPHLQGLRKEDIIKLTSNDGNLIQAKVLDEKKLDLNDQIKKIQDFNSDVRPEEILKQNKLNAAQYYNTFVRKRPSLANVDSLEHAPVVTPLKNSLRDST